MESIDGKTVWVFPDGELPPEGNFELKGHESIIILNMTQQEAEIYLTLYYVEEPPQGGIKINVAPERVRCIRTNDHRDMDGYVIPREKQYAMRFVSNVPVVMQYGRLDTRDQPMAFYTNSGYSSNL